MGFKENKIVLKMYTEQENIDIWPIIDGVDSLYGEYIIKLNKKIYKLSFILFISILLNVFCFFIINNNYIMG
jgi:hypothetical protein